MPGETIRKREEPSLLDRTLRQIRRGWQDVARSALSYLATNPRPDLPDEDLERLRAQMAECLEARGGEVSARARAADLGRSYLALNPTGRARFLALLASEFDIDRARVDEAAARLREADDEVQRHDAERALRAALQSPRRQLLARFTALPDGVKFLVDMRAELLPLARRDPHLASLADDLRELLAAWFDVGLLELQQITWRSPAALLEKLIRYEAVHQIKSWEDLKNRLDSDRRCFAFFHPAMPDEPLIFVEVALVSGMADGIVALLDESAPATDPAEADAAIFYSISNAQKGLAGISFGDFLIKRVVDLLTRELPRLKTFATLSPIPGFRGWLRDFLEGVGEPFLTSGERRALRAFDDAEDDAVLLGRLIERQGWEADEALREALRPPLLRMCMRYLAQEKRPNGSSVDPVAHFHLSNGARIERLNWLADPSSKGLAQSAGMMINYLYKLSEIEVNHEAYRGEGTVPLSSACRSLLRG